MRYTLEVWGELWSGAQAVYSYSVTEGDKDVLLKTDNVNRLAGDFNYVRDWRLVSETCVYRGDGAIKTRVDTFKTLRGFRNGMSPKRFYRLANS